MCYNVTSEVCNITCDCSDRPREVAMVKAVFKSRVLDTMEVMDVVVASTGLSRYICLEKHWLLSKMKSTFLAEGVGVMDDVDGRMKWECRRFERVVGIDQLARIEFWLDWESE